MSFASNLLGAMVGGALEYVALVTGFQFLLLVVAALYAVAFLLARRFRFLADATSWTTGRTRSGRHRRRQRSRPAPLRLPGRRARGAPAMAPLPHGVGSGPARRCPGRRRRG